MSLGLKPNIFALNIGYRNTRLLRMSIISQNTFTCWEPQCIATNLKAFIFEHNLEQNIDYILYFGKPLRALKIRFAERLKTSRVIKFPQQNNYDLWLLSATRSRPRDGTNAPWNSSKVPENPGTMVAISTPLKEWALDTPSSHRAALLFCPSEARGNITGMTRTTKRNSYKAITQQYGIWQKV